MSQDINFAPVFRIRIGLNTDPDPAFEVNTDPDSDPVFKVNTDLDAGFFMTYILPNFCLSSQFSSQIAIKTSIKDSQVQTKVCESSYKL